MAIGRREVVADELGQLASDDVRLGAVGIVHELEAVAMRIPGIVHARVEEPRLEDESCIMKSAGSGEAVPNRECRRNSW